MRTPKKVGKAKAKAPKGGGKAKVPKGDSMETEGPSSSRPQVFRPGVDEIGEDEQLTYDPTAYDCYEQFTLEWPSLSFDIIRDELGGPRSTFPHTLSLVAGTQAASAKLNYIAFVKLSKLGQGRHGKKAEQDDDSSSSDDGEDSDLEDGEGGEAPKQMHVRLVAHMGGINRIRSMPQKPGVVAVWGDSAQVKVYDGSGLVRELAGEAEPKKKAASTKLPLAPLASHSHSQEGFALDWSPVKAGRLASGDCRKAIHVWEPQEGGRWQVSGAYAGHEGSVEDLQWSPTEETVFASCSVDRTIGVWDTRERSKPMLTTLAHEADVNVISWNRLVTYMLASGADDGSLRIWDMRNFRAGEAVSHFAYHRAPLTSVEWSPYESSMLASSSSNSQLAVWDLALERDPEEEAALAPEGNAAAPEDMPAQLLFLHAGQQDTKELHWHAQIPGLLVSTAADGFNVFKPSNL